LVTRTSQRSSRRRGEMKIDNETMYKGTKVKQYLKQQAQEFEKMILEWAKSLLNNENRWEGFKENDCWISVDYKRLDKLLKEVQKGERK
jgi:hypothetical protein